MFSRQSRSWNDVVVGKENQLTASFSNADIPGCRWPLVFLPEIPNRDRRVAGQLRDKCSSGIGRPVIHDDNLGDAAQDSLVRVGSDCLQWRVASIVGWDHNAQRV